MNANTVRLIRIKPLKLESGLFKLEKNKYKKLFYFLFRSFTSSNEVYALKSVYRVSSSLTINEAHASSV